MAQKMRFGFAKRLSQSHYNLYDNVGKQSTYRVSIFPLLGLTMAHSMKLRMHHRLLLSKAPKIYALRAKPISSTALQDVMQED